MIHAAISNGHYRKMGNIERGHGKCSNEGT